MKIKKIIQIIILSLLLYSCGTVIKDALQGKKRSENSDEFLVQKKNPLILPPNYDELPVPSSGLEKQEIIKQLVIEGSSVFVVIKLIKKNALQIIQIIV